MERSSQLPRLALTAGWLLGPAAWAVALGGVGGHSEAAERAWARRAVRLLGMQLQLEGLDRIDPHERYVVVANHEGFADALVLLHLPLRMRFVARDELASWRVLSRALRLGGHVVLRPEAPVRAYRRLLDSGAEVLRHRSLAIFPQGTLLGIEMAFTDGAFRLAARTGRPVLPVAIAGSHRVWEHPFTPTVRFGRAVAARVLEPVPASSVWDRRRAIEQSIRNAASSLGPPPRHYLPERDGWWDEYRFEVSDGYPELARRLGRHRAGQRS